MATALDTVDSDSKGFLFKIKITFFTFPFWVVRVDFGYLRRVRNTSKQITGSKTHRNHPSGGISQPRGQWGRGRFRVWAHRKSRTVCAVEILETPRRFS